MSSATKSRQPKQRTFTLTIQIDGTDYRVSPLSVDPSIGSKAFRFHKLTADDKVYDLHLSPYGWSCDCPGHTHHGHCKHAEAVKKLTFLFTAAVETAIDTAAELAPF
jgi:hypothetical protein